MRLDDVELHLTEDSRTVHYLNFAKFVRTPFLQNTIGRLLLIIAVLIVVKGEFANKSIDYDAEIKT